MLLRHFFDYEVPAVPDKWFDLITEFTGHIADPATAFYDDTHGSTGPVAPKNKENTQILAQEYAKTSSTLSLPDVTASQTSGQSVPPAPDDSIGH